MEYMWIGKIVNTHGIKGELRILSDVEYKEIIFKKGVNLYIGKEKVKQTIESYRYHKIYDMVKLEGISDINEGILYKGENVYINREELKFPGILKQDLIGFEVESIQYRGKVTSIEKSKAHDLLVVENKGKRYLVPYRDEFIDKIDIEHKKIDIKYMKGLFDED